MIRRLWVAIAFLALLAGCWATEQHHATHSAQHGHAHHANHTITFKQYLPCKHEQLWIDNVVEWQTDVCAHLPNSTIMGSLKAISDFINMNETMMLRYMHKPTDFPDMAEYLSHYEYDITSGTTTSKFFVPIEGTIGLARDPRKCWNVMVETYTQSKEYFLPLNELLRQMFIRRVGNRREEPRTFYFDAGATYYSDSDRQGMKWVIDWYQSHGIRITNLIAWEMSIMSGDKILNGVPDWLIPGFQFYNHGIDKDPKSIWNPLNMIKAKCTKDDFVVFKLDIDNVDIESAVVDQLFSDPEARDLIDEFYYEQHFNNYAMRMHGWTTFPSSLTLAKYYQFVIPIRQKGFRMHYWP